MDLEGLKEHKESLLHREMLYEGVDKLQQQVFLQSWLVEGDTYSREG
jgi:hypothetical protein